MTANRYCPDGKSCYACKSGYIRSPNDPSGACITSTCSPTDAPTCEGSSLKTCTLQSNGLYAWTTTACSGICTTSSGTATCCTPNNNACTGYTCGTTTNNCGQTIQCGATNGGCPTGQSCSTTSGPGTCQATCTNQCTNGQTTCNGNTPQVCQVINGCTQWVSQTACTPQLQTCQNGTCQAITYTLLLDGTMMTTTSATSGTTLSLTPSLSPSASATYWNGTHTIGNTWHISITGQRGTIITRSLTAVINNVEVASRTIQITVTCQPGDACYCQSDATSGCVLGGPTSATTPDR